MRQTLGIRRRNSRREAGVGLLFILPSLTGCMVFVLIPFVDAVRRSLVHGVTGEWNGIRYYQEIFRSASFVTAVGNTARFIGYCVPLLVILSLSLALLLMRPALGRGLLRAAFLLPMAVPVASVALLWQLLFHRAGIVNGALAALGVPEIDWMHTDWALLCLIISYLWKNVGYDMVLFLAGLGGIPASLYEAASVDGAGRWRQFTAITLPCLRPTLLTVIVLSLLNAFKVYREAYLVAGNYPHSSIYLIQHTLNNWFAAMEIEKLSAAAVVTSGVILLLVALLNLSWRTGRAGR